MSDGSNSAVTSTEALWADQPALNPETTSEYTQKATKFDVLPSRVTKLRKSLSLSRMDHNQAGALKTGLAKTNKVLSYLDPEWFKKLRHNVSDNIGALINNRDNSITFMVKDAMTAVFHGEDTKQFEKPIDEILTKNVDEIAGKTLREIGIRKELLAALAEVTKPLNYLIPENLGSSGHGKLSKIADGKAAATIAFNVAMAINNPKISGEKNISPNGDLKDHVVLRVAARDEKTGKILREETRAARPIMADKTVGQLKEERGLDKINIAQKDGMSLLIESVTGGQFILGGVSRKKIQQKENANTPPEPNKTKSPERVHEEFSTRTGQKSANKVDETYDTRAGRTRNNSPEYNKASKIADMLDKVGNKEAVLDILRNGLKLGQNTEKEGVTRTDNKNDGDNDAIKLIDKIKEALKLGGDAVINLLAKQTMDILDKLEKMLEKAIESLNQSQNKQTITNDTADTPPAQSNRDPLSRNQGGVDKPSKAESANSNIQTDGTFIASNTQEKTQRPKENKEKSVIIDENNENQPEQRGKENKATQERRRQIVAKRTRINILKKILKRAAVTLGMQKKKELKDTQKNARRIEPKIKEIPSSDTGKLSADKSPHIDLNTLTKEAKANINRLRGSGMTDRKGKAGNNTSLPAQTTEAFNRR